MKHFILAGALCFCTYLGIAQVKGKLVELSQTGDTTTLPGALLHWENSQIASTSNENGDFKIDLDSKSRVLLIQALGYEPRRIAVTDTTKFLLLILKAGINLDDVDVVYYSNGTEVSYLNPMKIETLGERSLMKAACCNLSESFETNPSIDVSYADAVSGTRQIQMLGLSGQYAQITKENMPYLRGLAGNYGLTFIPGTWIQSIQLSKGAGSVINGYESFTGQINTELQNPASSDRLNFNVYANENARNEYNLNLSQKLSSKWHTGLLSHYSLNPLVQDLNKDGFADIPIGSQINVMNKYSYQDPKSGFEAQFGGAYLQDQRDGGQFKGLVGIADSLPLYKIGIKNRKAEAFSKTGIVFKKKPGHSAGLQLSFLDHLQDNTYGLSQYHGWQQTFYANFIYQGILRTSNHTYRIGASAMLDKVDETFQMMHFKRQEQVMGVFSEYAYNYKEKFNLVAGLRADQHNYYGLFFTPRIHLRYALRPSTVLRLSGGRALRTANIFTDNASLMASSRTWLIQNNSNNLPYGLQAEIGWNYGLNFTHKFKINFREAYVTLDAYRTNFAQQVIADLDQNTQEVNIKNLNGKSYSNTFQFEFNFEPRKRFFVKTAYRYVDTKVQYSTGLLARPYVSKNRAFINFSYETKKGHWQFDFTTQYNGAKRLPQTISNPSDYQRSSYSPNFFNVLGQITYIKRWNNRFLNVYLGVENLLNYKQQNPIVGSDAPFSKYFDASMVWGPIYGRMLYMGLRLRIK